MRLVSRWQYSPCIEPFSVKVSRDSLANRRKEVFKILSSLINGVYKGCKKDGLTYGGVK